MYYYHGINIHIVVIIIIMCRPPSTFGLPGASHAGTWTRSSLRSQNCFLPHASLGFRRRRYRTCQSGSGFQSSPTLSCWRCAVLPGRPQGMTCFILHHSRAAVSLAPCWGSYCSTQGVLCHLLPVGDYTPPLKGCCMICSLLGIKMQQSRGAVLFAPCLGCLLLYAVCTRCAFYWNICCSILFARAAWSNFTLVLGMCCSIHQKWWLR
jgi:hypothetical protein